MHEVGSVTDAQASTAHLHSRASNAQRMHVDAVPDGVSCSCVNAVQCVMAEPCSSSGAVSRTVVE